MGWFWLCHIKFAWFSFFLPSPQGLCNIVITPPLLTGSHFSKVFPLLDMLYSEPLSVITENCVILSKIFCHPDPLGDKKWVVPYGVAVFKFLIFFLNLLTPVLDCLFGPNILTSSQLVSAAPVSQRSWVKIPYGPEFFPGPIFNY